MMPDVQTFPAWCELKTNAGLTTKTILVTDGNVNQPMSLC
jgi:hypothetical protein